MITKVKDYYYAAIDCMGQKGKNDLHLNTITFPNSYTVAYCFEVGESRSKFWIEVQETSNPNVIRVDTHVMYLKRKNTWELLCYL